MKLSTAALAAGGAVVVLACGISLANFVLGASSITRVKNAISEQSQALGASREITAAAYELKIDVIQVQQWLTDISATRGLDGLDDGFDEAAAFAAKLEADLDHARKLAQRYDAPELATALDDVQSRFGPFYATGREMAQLYIEHGPVAGNAKMPEFDAVAESMGEAIDTMGLTIERLVTDQKQRSQSFAEETIAAENQRSLIDLISHVLLIAVVIAATVFSGQIFRRLNRVAATARSIAQWELDTPSLGETRWDELASLHETIEDLRERGHENQAFQLETKRHLAEAADFESRIAAIDSSQAMIEFTPEGNIVKANQNFLSAMGYSQNELTGQHHAVFMPSEEAASPAYSRFWQELAAGKTLIGEFKRVDKNGRTVWVHGAYNPLRDETGAVNRVVKYVNDVTARHAAVDALSNSLERLAEGDLSARIGTEVGGEFASLRDAFNSTMNRLQQMVVDIKRSSGSMETATREIVDGANELSERTTSQASSLEQTGATMEEMAASIRTTAENAERANGAASDAASRAARGGEVMNDAVAAMDRIESSSSRIGDIIEVIESISFQTNLLALNAAVEAARAGDAGKGFAVVAAEVRGLAQRSSDAAKDITRLIEESSRHVGDGVQLVHQTGDALRQIDEAVKSAASSIADITDASREQATGVEEISAAISQLDDITQRNAALAEQSAEKAGQMNNEVESMLRLTAFFRSSPDESERASDARWAATAPEPQRHIESPKPTAATGTDGDWAQF